MDCRYKYLGGGVAYGKDFTPQQRLAIVLEGIQAPSQLSEICEKHGISEDTYQDWKRTLLSSADQIYGTSIERAVDVLEGIPSIEQKTRVIGLGSTVFTEDLSDQPEDRWSVNTSFKVWAASYLEGDFFTESSHRNFKDMSILGGPAVAFSKGRNTISVSAIGPVNNWDDDSNFVEGPTPMNADGSADYFVVDVRFHRAFSDNLSLFGGYKVGRSTWKYRQHNASTGVLVDDQEQTVTAHGPIIGSNVSVPIFRINDSPLSLWGSVAYGPGIINHHDNKTDLNNTLNGDAVFGWYVNTEAGVAYNTTKNTAFSVSYRSDIWGDYQGGPDIMVGGAAATFSYKW